MRFLTVCALALSTRSATAYLNTSPFFLFSTSSRLESRHTTQIETANQVTDVIASILSSCPTKHYVLVTQAGVTTANYKDSQTTPKLASNLALKTSHAKSSITIPEVLGQINTQTWTQTLQKCSLSPTPVKLDSKDKSIHTHTEPTLFEITLPEVANPFPDFTLHENDAYLAWVLDMLPEKDYTVIYTTSVPAGEKTSEQATQYQMEDPLFDIPHTELRRDLSSYKITADNSTIDAPLFEKYQFFTPGIWMGFSVTILLLAILYVGVNALGSLQVTYAAFEKESGPQSSKKAQ